MDKVPARKLFSAELQRMKAKGQPPADSQACGGGAILEELSALREDMRELVAAVRGGSPLPPSSPMPGPGGPQEIDLLKTEIRALALAISQTKGEIAALRPRNEGDDRLMIVTNEMDAIVSATENATHGILEAAEQIDALAGQLQAQISDSLAQHIADDIRESVVSIFERCNFQDITGQRISKAVKTLQFIDERITRMMDIWGPDSFENLPTPPDVELDEEKKLLNGPALENQGISQDDIDKLFS